MSKTLEGYIGDEFGQPIEGIAATATRVSDGVVMDAGASGPDGRWAFTGLAEADEHFVTLLDGAGRAAVRGPWSGELREAWVRDRLNVAGLPVVLDPAAGNTLAWGPDGLYVPPIPPGIDAYTKTESDARYVELAGDTMSGTLAFLFEDAGAINALRTQDEEGVRFLLRGDGQMSWNAGSGFDTVLARTAAGVLSISGKPLTASPDSGNAFQWRANGFFSSVGLDIATADTRYVNLDGDVMSKTLSIENSSSTRYGVRVAGSLQRPAVDFERWLTTVGVIGEVAVGSTVGTLGFSASGPATMAYGGSIYAYVDGPIVGGTAPIAFSFYHATLGETYRLDSQGRGWFAPPADTSIFPATPGLYISGKWVGVSAVGGNSLTWNADGFYVAAGAVTDIWVNTTGDTMTGDLNMTAHVLPTVTNVRDLGSTSLRWRKLWAVDGEFTNAPTVGGVALLTATTADALFLTPAEGNAAYSLTAHTHDAAYVNVTGDTMTGDLTVQRDASVTEILMLKHASTGAGVRVAAYKSRGTVASPSATLVNDELGKITWYGRGNSADAFAAEIKAEVDAANAPSNVMQGRLLFLTTAVGGGMTERMRIDKDGRVTVNPLTDPALPAAYTGQPGLLVQLEGASQLQALALARADTSATATRLNFYRSRGTWASKVALADGDYPMSLEAWGWSGSQWLISSAIRSNVFGVVTTTAMPGSLSFLTADSAGALGARLSIGPAGLVGVGAKADGSAAAQIDVQSTLAGSTALAARAHASAAATLPFFQAINATGQIAFGVRNAAFVCDFFGAITAVSGPVRAVQFYNSAGTFIGWMPLYSTVT